MRGKPMRFTSEFNPDHIKDIFAGADKPPEYTYEQRYEHALTMLRRGGVTIPEPTELLPDIEAVARAIADNRLHFLPLSYRELEDAVDGEPAAVTAVQIVPKAIP